MLTVCSGIVMDNRELIVLVPQKLSDVMQNAINEILDNKSYQLISSCENMGRMDNKIILFAIELGDSGINIELFKMLDVIFKSGKTFMKNSLGGVIIHSNNELFTRSVSRQIIFYCNMSGCTFPPRPLVEATGSFNNLISYKKLSGLPYEQIFLNSCKELLEGLISFEFPKYKRPNILMLHASNYKTSNTLLLWNMVKSKLSQCDINELHIENGSVKDCKACSFQTCTHFSENNTCFYGGIMVEDIYPAILSCDILIFICPNYNDAISANLTAVINRFTALFRNNDFDRKSLFSIVVSGHCGSDIIAEQLISAMNINKKFILPPYFTLMETANDKGKILEVEGIEEKAEEFANNIRSLFEE